MCGGSLWETEDIQISSRCSLTSRLLECSDAPQDKVFINITHENIISIENTDQDASAKDIPFISQNCT